MEERTKWVIEQFFSSNNKENKVRNYAKLIVYVVWSMSNRHADIKMYIDICAFVIGIFTESLLCLSSIDAVKITFPS